MAGGGAVAILAAVLRDPALFVGLLPVRALLPAVVDLFVAGLAGLRTGIVRNCGSDVAADFESLAAGADPPSVAVAF